MLANSYVKNEGLYIMEVCQVKYWLIAALKIVSFIYLFILFHFFKNEGVQTFSSI